jgi:5-enolpyruvylshikimate-3-phosphate synthase
MVILFTDGIEKKMEADIMEREDGLIINGRPQNGKPRGLKPADFIHKAGIEAANITYPGFFQALESLGAKVTITNR